MDFSIVSKEQDDLKKWETFPDGVRLNINGEPHVRWYDCITDKFCKRNRSSSAPIFLSLLGG